MHLGFASKNRAEHIARITTALSVPEIPVAMFVEEPGTLRKSKKTGERLCQTKLHCFMYGG
jgi:hypothetical protein